MRNGWVNARWGRYYTIEKDASYWIKKIVVLPGNRLSLQSHRHRREVWVAISGEGVAVIHDWPKTLRYGARHWLTAGSQVEIDAGVKHRLENVGEDNLVVLEIAFGAPDEEDIVRYEDDYGRVK